LNVITGGVAPAGRAGGAGAFGACVAACDAASGAIDMMVAAASGATIVTHRLLLTILWLVDTRVIPSLRGGRGCRPRSRPSP
jgi:hypothetical protein